MFDLLTEKFSSIVQKLSGSGSLNQRVIQDTLQHVSDALLQADVPYEVVQDFIQQVSSELVTIKPNRSLKPAEQVMNSIRTHIIAFLGQKSEAISVASGVIMMMGLQGSGKTTTISKLVYYAQQQSKKRNESLKILCASVDFYRPAAVKQLEVLANKLGVDFYSSSLTDPVQAAKDCKKYADQNQYDLFFLDTAGRLHVDKTMLDELQKITAVVNPTTKLLVVDAMTGQQSLNVAQSFNDRIGFDGAVLAKMDSQAAGGAAFAFQYVLKKPILFLGIGEKHTDFELFKADRIADRMIGNGDLATLAEMAEQKIKKAEQERMEKAITQGKLTLEDFANQIDMMNRMGPLSSLMKYMPQMGGMKLSQDQIDQGQQQVKQFRAIIGSMTLKERKNHRLLNKSRKQRIAKGAGCQLVQVDMLLQRFEQMQQFAKLFKRM